MIEALQFHWPYPSSWLWVGSLLYLVCLAWHARALLKTTTTLEGAKLLFLRGLAGLFFFLLITRPFVEHLETDPRAVRIISLVDFSGSMDDKDSGETEKRIDQVRPFLDLDEPQSWVNQARNKFGKVDRMGFIDSEVSMIRSFSWSSPLKGKNTSIGDSLIKVLESSKEEIPGAVVLFSDGRNNMGISPLVAAEKFRENKIPVHVVGVGRKSELGNLSVRFIDFPEEVTAKQELLLSAEVTNGFASPMQTKVKLFSNDRELESRDLNLQNGEAQSIHFDPYVPEVAGVRTFRVVIHSLDGDMDQGDDSDVQVINVRPPSFFSALYLSNRVHPLYSFLKQALMNERFQLSSLIRLGEKTFHARGDQVSPDGYPQNSDFWMDYDVVIMDSAVLEELNSSLVLSLKDFVHKRGGGLLLFGDGGSASKRLGGLMPAVQTKKSMAKDNLTLAVLPDPLFTERKGVSDWKPFLPAGLPAQVITEVNPAAQRIVHLRSNFNQAVLAVQAYGAGKSAFWGSSHDWRRALIDESQSREFSIFWQGLVEWLGSGTVERIKVQEGSEPVQAGQENQLVVEVLGQDFEPSMDAKVEANITGPGGYSKTLQLYPKGGLVGSYEAMFTPTVSGSYRVNYNLLYPDGEKLERLSYLQIEQGGMEAKDTRFAEKDLRMLAKISGGEYIPIAKLRHDWSPPLSDSLPATRKTKNLADAWPIFLVLFLLAGIEWIWRRKGGLK